MPTLPKGFVLRADNPEVRALRVQTKRSGTLLPGVQSRWYEKNKNDRADGTIYHA
jgi:hypothetical protein